MGIFDFLKGKKNNKSKTEVVSEMNTVSDIKKEDIKSTLVTETSYSTTIKEKNGVFERISFVLAGTSFYQDNIQKVIQEELKTNPFFNEKYEGRKNKEILEDTFDEPIFEYHDLMFLNCRLQLEPDNEYDSKAIAVYVESFMIGHVPKKHFGDGKEYLYQQLNGGLKDNQQLNSTLSLRGGKYKVNRGNDKVETGISDYKLDGRVTIKTEIE